LFGDPRLSITAKRFLETAARNRREVVLTSISLAEVVYLVHKNRLPATAFEDLTTAIHNPNHVVEAAALTTGVAAAMRLVLSCYAEDLVSTSP
jgi:predicted nucleic acid-binding protein